MVRRTIPWSSENNWVIQVKHWRSKTNQKYGLPLETVTYKKQEKLRKTAEYYLHLHPELAELYCRFDVVSVVWQGEKASVQWIADAFQ